jgi:hypothetical protein
VTINTLGNDESGNTGSELVTSSVTITTTPSNGTAAVDPLTGNITYTPNAGFIGMDTIYYEVCNDLTPAQCETGMQIITVLPIGAANTTTATDDFNSGIQGQTISGSVLSNDIDPESGVQTVTAETITTAAGTFSIDATGNYTFIPVSTFTGPVYFTYNVCDDGSPQSCAQATIYLLVSPSRIFPIELLYFKAEEHNCNAKLSWATATEHNTEMFEIWRSFTGYNDFERIAQVSAAGNSTNTLHYSYTDKNAKKTSYYQIISVDVDGTREASRIEKVSLMDCYDKADQDGFSIYPNPHYQGDLSVNYYTEQAQTITLKVTDALGRLITTRIYNADSGINTFPILLENLSSGTYFINIQDDSAEKKVRKFIHLN